MASRKFCSNIGEELEVWSVKLHDFSGKDRQNAVY